MKIVCLTAVHKRREITGIFYQAFADQRARALKEGIDLSLQVVASEAEDIALANYYGHAPAEAPNLPLGAKHNTGLEHAMAQDFDYLMQLGSDDFLCDSFWLNKDVKQALEQKLPIFGFNNLLVMHATERKMKTSNFLRPFGAGRFIHRSLLDSAVHCKPVRWKHSCTGKTHQRGKGSTEVLPTKLIKPAMHEVLSDVTTVQLWEPNKNAGLDYSSESRLIWVHGMHKARCRVLPGKDMVMDVKTGSNIHSYDKRPGTELSQFQYDMTSEGFSFVRTIEDAYRGRGGLNRQC
jgi:hypothetical protein